MSELFDAIEDEDLEALRALLEGGASTAVHGPNGWTPVHAAAVWGEPSALRMLLERGAAVDAPAGLDGGPAPLSDAAFAGRADSVEILLRHGAKREREDAFGRTALEAAREANRGPEVAHRYGDRLQGGLVASEGRWLYEELNLAGKSELQREVIALLELG